MITATCPIKPLLNFSQYHDLLRQLPFGKRLPGATNIYGSCYIHKPLDQLIQEIARPCPATEQHNILKLRTDAFRISFLAYPDFMTDPTPTSDTP